MLSAWPNVASNCWDSQPVVKALKSLPNRSIFYYY
jgi:hypothetical protein